MIGNSQPDEILRKENKNRGSRRDSHVPKAMAVKTIRNRGDAAKTAALQSMRNGNLRDKRRDPWRGPTHRQKRWPTRRQRARIRIEYWRVPAWSAGQWPQPLAERANKPHPRIHVSQDLERPCYEADNSARHGE